MARAKDHNLQKHTINLRAGDMDALRAMLPNREPSLVLRQLLSNFVDNLRKKSSGLPEEPIDI